MKAGDRSNQQPKADKWSVGCPYEGLGWVWGLRSAPRLVLVFLRKPSIFPSPISSTSLGRVPPGSRPSPPSFRKAPFLYTFQGNALTSLVPVTWVFPRLGHRNLILSQTFLHPWHHISTSPPSFNWVPSILSAFNLNKMEYIFHLCK